MWYLCSRCKGVVEIKAGLVRSVLCGCVAHVASKSVRLWVQFLSSRENLLKVHPKFATLKNSLTRFHVIFSRQIAINNK